MAEQKHRLDTLLVEKGLAETREKARRLILAGRVIVSGISNPKPGMRVPLDIQIEMKAPFRFVSRGGCKLAAALDEFRIHPGGWTCLDVGASTGGFTDCLLQEDARKVYAVDVGYGQFHYRLRNHPRVVLLERVNARYLSRKQVPEPVDLAVVDVSFISLRLILPPVYDLLSPEGTALVLVKPQFEAGRDRVPRGGVIRDRAVHHEVLENLIGEWKQGGWEVLGIVPSTVPGVSGNREYFARLVRNREGETSWRSETIKLEDVVSRAFAIPERPGGDPV